MMTVLRFQCRVAPQAAHGDSDIRSCETAGVIDTVPYEYQLALRRFWTE